MLKARRKEQIEEVRFPEPREGLPEDPRPFLGTQHLIAAASVQEWLSTRCLVAVVGRLGSGKSTVCRRAANSRWARQWFLQDERGQPVHRRFWVDLEDCHPGAETQERVAHALGRPTFAEGVARLGNGRPCLLILDNADHVFGESDGTDTLAQLAACVERGACIVVTRRQVSDMVVDRPWTDVVEVEGFGGHDEAKQLFDQLAPEHAADLRSPAIVAACDRLPLAVKLLANVAAGADLEVARLRIGPGIEDRSGLDFAVEVSAAMLEPEDRHVWGALSLFPSGLAADDIRETFSAVGDARERTIRLHAIGIAHRCEAGVRIPAPLRLAPSASNLSDVAQSDLWGSYVRRARVMVGPLTATGGNGPGGTGAAVQSGRGRREQSPQASFDAQAADEWLIRQYASLGRLASRPSLSEGTFDLAGAALLIHRSGIVPDALDGLLLGLLEATLADAAPSALATATPGTAVWAQTDVKARANSNAARAAHIAAALEDQRRFGTSVLLATALAEADRHAGDVRGEAEALCQLGRAERLWSRYEDAETHLAESHQLYEKLDDGVGQGCALFELGQVALDRGRLDDAEVYLGEALDVFAANGRPVGQANTDLELVRADLARGRVDSAERRLGDAMDRYEEAGDRLGFANACLQLGQVELARGRLDSAERRLGGALDGYEQAGDKVGFANACLQLGQVELARGRLDTAQRRFSGALAGYEQVGDQVGLANSALQLGQIDLARGRLATAGSCLLQALEAYEQLGDRIGVANAALQLGQVDLGQGDLEAAEERLSAAQWAYDAIGDVAGSANSRHVRAMLRQAQGQPTYAMAMFGEAARLYVSIGRTASAAWSFAGAARACSGRAERIGYAADAVRLLQQAGLAEAAAKLAVDLAEPAPQPRPEPVVMRMSHPAPGTEPGEVPDPDPVPVPDAMPAFEAWPRVIEVMEAASRETTPDPTPGADSPLEALEDTVPDVVPESVGSTSEAPADAAVEAEEPSQPIEWREPDTKPHDIWRSPESLTAVAAITPAAYEPATATATEPEPEPATEAATEHSGLPEAAEPGEPVSAAATPSSESSDAADPDIATHPEAEPVDVRLWQEAVAVAPTPSAHTAGDGKWYLTSSTEGTPSALAEAREPVPATEGDPLPPEELPPEELPPQVGPRKGRLRWGRRKERPPGSPTLPGMEP